MIGAGMKVIMYVTYLALCLVCGGASLVAHMIKNLPAMQETWVLSLGQVDPLEKGMATHSSILAWRIPWIEATVCGVTKNQTRVHN